MIVEYCDLTAAVYTVVMVTCTLVNTHLDFH